MHAGIVRLVNLSTQQQIAVCLRVLAQHETTLKANAIITAELNRVRIRQSKQYTAE